MSWWVILLIIIGAFILYDIAVGRKDRKLRYDREKELFRQVATTQQQRQYENLTRLDNSNEQSAQRIKKLFYSASFHETRNLTAFQNILKELSQMREEILQAGGKEKMKIISDRVIFLCGNDMQGFYEYLSILTQVNETAGTH